MPILVTGATGFLGAALTRQLLSEGHAVRILRRDTSPLGLLGPAAAQVEHAIGDVTDLASLDAAMAGITHVYHLAAIVAFGGRRDKERLQQVNVDGTAKVVNAALAARVTRLVHTSSIAALGRPAVPGTPIDETADWVESPNNTYYARSKHAAEREIHRGIAEGLDAVLVNPSVIFGVGRPGEGTMQVVERVRAGRMKLVPPGGTNVVDVEDVAAGHRRAMAEGQPGERYLLVGENRTWWSIVETLAEAFGVGGPRRVLPKPMLQLAGLVGEAAGWVPGMRPPVTRESARAASHFFHYQNDKAVAELGCQFRPFEATARHIASALG